MIERFYKICLFRFTGIPMLNNLLSLIYKPFNSIKLIPNKISLFYKLNIFFRQKKFVWFNKNIIFNNSVYLTHFNDVQVPFE